MVVKSNKSEKKQKTNKPLIKDSIENLRMQDRVFGFSDEFVKVDGEILQIAPTVEEAEKIKADMLDKIAKQHQKGKKQRKDSKGRER